MFGYTKGMEQLDSATINFARGKIIPVSFCWYGRDYEIARINLVFTRKDGDRKYLCFSVDTGGMSVELRLDTTDLRFFIIHE